MPIKLKWRRVPEPADGHWRGQSVSSAKSQRIEAVLEARS